MNSQQSQVKKGAPAVMVGGRRIRQGRPPHLVRGAKASNDMERIRKQLAALATKSKTLLVNSQVATVRFATPDGNVLMHCSSPNVPKGMVYFQAAKCLLFEPNCLLTTEALARLPIDLPPTSGDENSLCLEDLELYPSSKDITGIITNHAGRKLMTDFSALGFKRAKIELVEMTLINKVRWLFREPAVWLLRNNREEIVAQAVMGEYQPIVPEQPTGPGAPGAWKDGEEEEMPSALIGDSEPSIDTATPLNGPSGREQFFAAAGLAAEADVPPEEEVGEEDATGLGEDDIAIVVQQAMLSRNAAIRVLRRYNGDIVDAMMNLGEPTVPLP